MTCDEFQDGVLRTECDQLKAAERVYAPPAGYGVNDLIRLLHSQLGMANEVGEIGGWVQKLVFYGKPITKDELRAKLLDEYGDVVWHLCQGLEAVGLRLEDVLAANRRKLVTRYPDAGWDAARAADENRDRAAEAAAVSGRAPAPVVHWRLPGSIKATECGAIASGESYTYTAAQATCPSCRAEADRHERLEKQHLGDPDKKTGVYAPRDDVRGELTEGEQMRRAADAAVLDLLERPARVPGPGYGVAVKDFHTLDKDLGTVAAGTKVGRDVYGNLCLDLRAEAAKPTGDEGTPLGWYTTHDRPPRGTDGAAVE